MIAFDFLDRCPVENNPISFDSRDSWSMHRCELRRPIPRIYEELHPRLRRLARKLERDFVQSSARNPIVSRDTNIFRYYSNYLDLFLLVRIGLLHLRLSVAIQIYLNRRPNAPCRPCIRDPQDFCCFPLKQLAAQYERRMLLLQGFFGALPGRWRQLEGLQRALQQATACAASLRSNRVD